ncbi:MAG: hypothetical protein JNM84_09835 [Planctomycetes bacterium]|nr:hypothetical protein [Planctomycetota bacterium]
MHAPDPATSPSFDLDAARRRFVRRVLGAAALVAPLFLTLGWWTSRSFLLRETRFNQLALEVQIPRSTPRGLGVPVRFVTRDPLGRPHRAQVKWVARDSAGAELLRGAVDSLGTHEAILPSEIADIARLEVRASDGAWGRNAVFDVRRGAPASGVRLERFPCDAAGDLLLLAQRELTSAPTSDAVFVAYDETGVPIARRTVRWEGPFALARWRSRPEVGEARRFEVLDIAGELVAELDLALAPQHVAESGAVLHVARVERGTGLRIEVALGVAEEAELSWFDAERIHARQTVRRGGATGFDLLSSARCVGRSFVRLVARDGAALALVELPPMEPDDLRATVARSASDGALEIELSDLAGAPLAGAALAVGAALERATEEARALDPRVLGYFGASAAERARLGYGPLAVVYSSRADREAHLAVRESEELFARRLVFGTAMALAGLCAAIWLFFLVRSRSAAVPPAWRLGFGASALALVLALVASKLWWGSELRASDPSLALAENTAAPLDHGALESLSLTSLAELEAPLALVAKLDDRGRARIPAPMFAEATRICLLVAHARGLRRAELPLPPR